MANPALTPIPSEPTPPEAFAPPKRPKAADLEAVIQESISEGDAAPAASADAVDITNGSAVRANVSRSQIVGSVASQERRMAELRISSVVQTRDAIQDQINARKALYDADRAALAAQARKIDSEYQADVEALQEQDRSARGVLAALNALVESCEKLSSGAPV